MEEADGEDGEAAVGDRAILADRGEDDDAANEEDDDELKEGHLSAGAAGEDANSEQEKEVADDGVKDGGHGDETPGAI